MFDLLNILLDNNKMIDKTELDPNDKPLGPILIETNLFEHPFDLHKLPGKYKKICASIVKDRDTGHESEIIIKWGDKIIYRSNAVGMFDEINDKIRIEAFKLKSIDNKIEMVFTD